MNSTAPARVEIEEVSSRLDFDAAVYATVYDAILAAQPRGWETLQVTPACAPDCAAVHEHVKQDYVTITWFKRKG